MTTAPLAGGKTFYLHVLKNPGAVLEIPVARKSRIKSVAALADGSAIVLSGDVKHETSLKYPHVLYTLVDPHALDAPHKNAFYA